MQPGLVGHHAVGRGVERPGGGEHGGEVRQGAAGGLADPEGAGPGRPAGVVEGGVGPGGVVVDGRPPGVAPRRGREDRAGAAVGHAGVDLRVGVEGVEHCAVGGGEPHRRTAGRELVVGVGRVARPVLARREHEQGLARRQRGGRKSPRGVEIAQAHVGQVDRRGADVVQLDPVGLVAVFVEHAGPVLGHDLGDRERAGRGRLWGRLGVDRAGVLVRRVGGRVGRVRRVAGLRPGVRAAGAAERRDEREVVATDHGGLSTVACGGGITGSLSRTCRRRRRRGATGGTARVRSRRGGAC